MAELKLVQERHAVVKGYSAEYVTIYENEVYKVFLVDDAESVRANVVNKEHNYPSILVSDGGHGGINVPALGTLKPEALVEYIQRMEYAKSTYEQAYSLVIEYVR